MTADKPCGEDVGRPKHGHDGVGDVAIVAVFFERCDSRFGWIAAVFADQEISQWHYQVIEGYRHPEHKYAMREQVKHDADVHQRRNKDGEQPEVTLAVAICGR